MKKLAKVLCLCLTLCMVLPLVLSCGKSQNDYLGVMLSTNVMSLDTNLATDGESFEVIADCIDGLMQMDATGAATYAIAESYDLSDDGKTYTFHLRDAKWSNGDPVTADDFVFAWRRIALLRGEYAYMLDEIGQIKGAADIISGKTDDTTGLAVTAKDSKTLVVELEVPVSFFPSLMYFPTFFPINEKFYTSLKEGTYGTSPATFLSNGAFILENYVPG
ncbi:MAG: ABC transporter substrate-binding protein, partial [Clostridia bacterium]|nr:ABC transporter substrate-binding protein [Clostridia bacterium]